ncbi:MAG: hypothetical protein WCG26_05045 [Chloroflexales bacterium]
MTQTTTNESIRALRLYPKDLGVAVIVLLCLLGGWLLMQVTITRTRSFQTDLAPITFTYPSGWIATALPENVLLQVADPGTTSAFKTTLTVESRLLDPTSLPTLQTLLDQRVAERQTLPSYHFLADAETEVAGTRAMRSEFAYVAQPIDAPRRAALPVVVHAAEYIIVAKDELYYVTLAAPEGEFPAARAQLDRVIASLKVQ